MLYTSHGILLAVVALIASDESLANATTEERIFASSLSHTSPTGVDGNIHHRTIHPVDSLCRGFLGSYTRTILNGLYIPRASLRQWYRKYSLIAMDNVLTDEQWNTKTALLDSNALQLLDFVLSLDIEHGTELTFGSELSQRTVHNRSSCNVIARQEIELTDFLFESHLRHQFVDELIHRFLLGKY